MRSGKCGILANKNISIVTPYRLLEVQEGNFRYEIGWAQY
jgi:hypothetical protein